MSDPICCNCLHFRDKPVKKDSHFNEDDSLIRILSSSNNNNNSTLAVGCRLYFLVGVALVLFFFVLLALIGFLFVWCCYCFVMFSCLVCCALPLLIHATTHLWYIYAHVCVVAMHKHCVCHCSADKTGRSQAAE